MKTDKSKSMSEKYAWIDMITVEFSPTSVAKALLAEVRRLEGLLFEHEDERHVIEPASDADMLRHLMEAKGVSQALLSEDTGLPKSSISEVLSGKKNFSRLMIRKLAEYFKVDIGVLASNI